MNFIFIVGAPRSGTTWLQALLASHPQVVTGQETHFFEAFDKFLSFFKERRYWRTVGLQAYWPNNTEKQLCRIYFMEFIKPIIGRCNKDIIYFLEKTPEHVFYMPLISEAFPEAKFIHLIRDGRHVVASLKRVYKANNAFISTTMAALTWNKCVSFGRSFGRKLPSNKYYELKYEDLRSMTFDTLAKIFSWLGLNYNEYTIQEIINKCSLDRLKKNKKFNTINSTSEEPEGFFGSGSVGNNFTLTKLELDRVYDICGPLLKELGYIDKIPKIPLWSKIRFSYKIRNLLRLKEF